jgi:hypothetical protein
MRKFLVLASCLVASLFLSACSLNSLKVKSGLQILTNDVPATIFLDGKQLSKTPFIDKDIAPGEYTVQIQPEDPNLASYETKITLRKGLLTVITWKPGTRPETSGGVIYEMEPLKNKNTSELSLISIPDAAIVNVDNQSKGFAPVLVENIKTGEHEFDVSLPSYETQKHTINVLPGHRMNVTVKLAKLESTTGAGTTATSAANTSGITAGTNPSPTPITSVTPVKAVLPPPKVKIKATGVKQNNQEGLRVRDQAGSGGKEIGFALTDAEYAYLNETSNNWYKIQFENQVGWISGQYAQLITQ